MSTPCQVQGFKSLIQREALTELLSSDLAFHDQASNSACHAIHAFAAKFPPQLPSIFIEGLTNDGEAVLDPMMGSGTAIVEAFLCGRRAIGFDLDPLALLICKVKSRPLDVVGAAWAGREVVTLAAKLLEKPGSLESQLTKRYSDETRKFIEYWFSKKSRLELMALLLGIEKVEKDQDIEDFLRVVFSSIIITKSGGVSLAYDLAHSRPHRVDDKPARDALEEFNKRLSRAVVALAQLPRNGRSVVIKQHDCRERMPLADQSIQLVITSPPYANAIDPD